MTQDGHTKKTLGLLGLGAFGRLMLKHLAPHFDIRAFDPSPEAVAFGQDHGVTMVSCEEVAKAEIVVLGPPVPRMGEAVASIRDHLVPGTLVLDVGSVKYNIANLLVQELPDHVDVVCTHPLFGPQSGKDGIAGLKIAVCPVRGEDRAQKVIAFLRDVLDLNVIVTTPENHDREMAAVMGLTHMVAKVLLEMEPLPTDLTTKSYERLMEAVDILRYDSMELFLAIEHDNPFSTEVRKTFFAKADALRQFLEDHDYKKE
ncbi:MAG: prephenate dehydrogenase/arogenate dehydrogenase family protein [Alphaproteobacteria bacterium]|nr:prephenate dehydrogenase/arogenate dehydrogenase family protein [Alphaproteobacteria bacterium]